MLLKYILSKLCYGCETLTTQLHCTTTKLSKQTQDKDDFLQIVVTKIHLWDTLTPKEG